MIQFHLKTSKCNQFWASTDVVIGCTGNQLCPVEAILKYIKAPRDQEVPFFLDASHNLITKQHFISRIRDILMAIGLPQHQFAGHSFIIHAAMTAAAAGIEDSTIQTLGHWNSATYLQYIHTQKERLAAISTTLASTGRLRTSGAHPATTLEQNS